MKTDMLSLMVLPLGAMAATLVSWGILGIALMLLQRRKAQHRSEATVAPPDFGRSPASHPADSAIPHAELKVRRGLGFVIVTPPMMLAAYGAALFLDALDEEGYVLFGLAVGGSLLWVLAFSIYKGARAYRREAYWHDNAKVMVAQAVAPLAQRGYVVFRDFKAENISVDYLIISSKGVFALQGLIQPTGTPVGPDSEAVVTYNGRALFYPHGKDHLIIEWADGQAELLSDWLSQGLETPLAARAVLAMPGWRVKRISADGISVINPEQLEALFQYIKPRPIPAATVQTIVARIEAHYSTSQSVPNKQSVSEPA
ncbi:MAG: hypothetical protein WAU91_12795 [Desulfatitalea sp.]